MYQLTAVDRPGPELFELDFFGPGHYLPALGPY